MKKGLLFCLLVFALSFAGCLISEEEEGTGTLKVTVNTSPVIWTYPKESLTFSGASNYRWLYSEVGGDGVVANLPAGYYPDATWCDTNSTKNITGKEGTLDNHVYIFSAIEQKSDINPVLYNGESDINGGVITISVKPGTYYVAAFYNYASGGELENIFNRYDRYALYAETADAVTGNSTPYYDKAGTITISEGQTVEITLYIHENWVLGKPKADNRDMATPTDDTTATIKYEMGRYYLKDGEPIPTP